MDTLYNIFLITAYVAVIGFFIFGLDDVFFDMQFLRYLRKKRRRKSVSLEGLKNEPEQLIAIFIPAWMESEVIGRMAEYMNRILLYDRYDIFIGVYPNDEETSRCVDVLAAACPRIHKVVTASPGPTSKADCLNAIYAGMEAHEIPGVREYRIIALHDAEDILHPLTLKVYNYHVPRVFDMGQIPVFPLELDPMKYWVGNTYLDEFSEWHMKDMYSREVMGGVVPSAGVGTAITREALQFLESRHDGVPFEVGNLAEDYMVGLELCRGGFRAGFIDFQVEREVRQKDSSGNVVSVRTVNERVAVRENFPTKFFQAVRQKARWIIGTAFQGWERGGWWGTVAVKYSLVRDRRAPLVHCINAAGYCVVFYVLAEFILLHSGQRATVFLRPIFAPESLLWRLVLVDTALLAYRVGQKVSFVSEVYGPRQGFFAIPRYPVVNLVNMFSTFRAARLYFRHRIFKHPLAWTKTSHEFPGAAALSEFARSIEDLLVEEGIISRPDLEDVMSSNRGLSAPEALLRLGLIDEAQFTSAWAKYSRLATKIAVPDDVPSAVIQAWPESEALSRRAMPCGLGEGSSIEFLFEEPPSAEAVAAISAAVKAPVKPVLGRPTNLLCLRQEIYPRPLIHMMRHDCFDWVLASLSAIDRQRVVELRVTKRRSLADALISLNFLSEDEARTIFAKHLGIIPVNLAGQSIDSALAERLGPLFCEVHQVVPLAGGMVAIGESTPPDVLMRIRSVPGITLCADCPPAFLGTWRKLMGLRLSEAALMERMEEDQIVSAESAEQVRGMQKLIAGPLDRLLLQLNIISREQLREALRATSGLETGKATHEPPAGNISELLAPGFSERSGILVSEIRISGPVFTLRQLPTESDLIELYERCDGAGAKFELEALL